jgi:hypothetical protein
MFSKREPNDAEQASQEKTSYRNTLSLFFGALLGANLGTLRGLSVNEYLSLVMILAITLMIIQVITVARSRLYAIFVISLYVGLWIYGYATDAFRPAALAQEDFDKLAVTLAIWLLMVTVIELTPVVASDEKQTRS